MTDKELYKLWIDKGQGMKALKSIYQKGGNDVIDEAICKIQDTDMMTMEKFIIISILKDLKGQNK